MEPVSRVGVGCMPHPRWVDLGQEKLQPGTSGHFAEDWLSLSSSDCLRTHYVYQAGLDLTGVGIKGTLEPALSLHSNVVFSICVYVCICARGQKGASHAPLWS